MVPHRGRSLTRTIQQAAQSYGAFQLGERAARALSRAARKRRRSNNDRVQPLHASPAPLTGQYDYKTDYVKRRLRGRRRYRLQRRRRWRRRVTRLIRDKSVATTHVLRRSIWRYGSVLDASDTACFGLYGMNGRQDQFDTTDDVSSLFRELWGTSFTDIADPNLQSLNTKMYYYNATLEITIRNTGSNDALVEAYYIRGRRMLPTTYESPVEVFRKGFNKQPGAENPDTETTGNDDPITSTMIGSTPFQNALFTRHFSIYKRQKFRIPPGNEVNIVIRDPKFRSFNIFETATRTLDHRYHGVLFQQQGPPEAEGEPSNFKVALPTVCSYLAVRRYRAKLMKSQYVTDVFDKQG